jgi:hypothetical protein
MLGWISIVAQSQACVRVRGAHLLIVNDRTCLRALSAKLGGEDEGDQLRRQQAIPVCAATSTITGPSTIRTCDPISRISWPLDARP